MRWRFCFVLTLLACAGVSHDALAGVLPEGVHAGIGIENGGHDSVGPYKIRDFIELQNQLGTNERIQVTGTHSQDFKELNGVAGTWEQPLGGNWRLLFNGSYNVTRPGGFINQIYDQSTHDDGFGGTALGSTLSYTSHLSGDLVVIYTVGIQTVDSETRQNSKIAALPSNSYAQRTRDLQGSIAINYNISDDTGLFSAFGVEHGIDWRNPAHVRMNVDDTPTVLRYSGSLKHNLPMAWQVVLKGTAQWTPDRVNELKMFSLGGWDYAVAYPSGERVGDVGAAGRLELNHLSVANLAGDTQLYYQPFVFVDGGFTRFNNPLPTEVAGTQTKASAGVGISLELTNGIHGGVQVAFPLTGRSSFSDAPRDARVLFSVGVRL